MGARVRSSHDGVASLVSPLADSRQPSVKFLNSAFHRGFSGRSVAACFPEPTCEKYILRALFGWHAVASRLLRDLLTAAGDATEQTKVVLAGKVGVESQRTECIERFCS